MACLPPQAAHAMKILLIDNYDSFTWNLVHLAGGLGANVEVVRNDAVSIAELAERRPDALILSPGPGDPNDAGITLEAISALGATMPIFGVCLGMQAIGQAYGGTIVRAPQPMHGKASTIGHDGSGVFRGVNREISCIRYHSLVIRREDCPKELRISAETDHGLIMAISHRKNPVHGVQFHPESVLSEGGAAIMKNFLDLAWEWNNRVEKTQL
jgi:anthranilate synthase component 2